MSRVTEAIRNNGLLALFAASVVAASVWILNSTGATIPFLPSNTYTVAFEAPDAGNLVPAGEVQVAGVRVGSVEKIDNTGGSAHIEFSLDSDAAPLHEGVQVRVGERTLAGESYIKVTDGTGQELASDVNLPASAVRPSVHLHNVIRSFDPQTRASLSGLSRTLGDATQGSHEDLAKVFTGLGDLGREGHTAIDAIAAQSEDLTALTAETSSVLEAVNTGEGQIGDLVQNAQHITSATSGQEDNLRESVRKLPEVLDSANKATPKLRKLSTGLAPVAADLKDASPHLTAALNELPATTADLRALLPSLNGTLGKAPATLDRVPQLNTDVQGLVPGLRTTLSNLNPMLSYLEPYGSDLAAFFTNFRGIFGPTDEAGVNYLRLQPLVANERVPNGVPLKLPRVLSHDNAYPKPGEAQNPSQSNTFPRLQPQPR